MSTLKVNNLSQAAKELEAIKKGLSKSVNTDIKTADRKNYHVALVRITERPGQVENKVDVVVQQYNDRAFKKLKKQTVYLGYSHAIVLHDPTNEESLEPTLTGFEKTKTVEQVTKELEAKHKKEKEDLINQLNEAKKKGEPIDPPAESKVKGDPDFDIEKATVDELNAFAEANSIELNGAKLKDELKEVIGKWLDAVRNEEAGK